MTHLKLFLLGPPRIELEHQVVDLQRRKVLALLAYLGMEQGAQRRDTLATLFWPEMGQSDARMALNRHLSDLRKALGQALIMADRETVALAPAAQLWLDVEQFQQTLAAYPTAMAVASPQAASLLTDAINLYRDDFLAGFSLTDAPLFDDWQFFARETLRRQLAIGLECLVGWHRTQQVYETAIHYARRWLALDPLHEPAHCCLMQLYGAVGQQAALHRQYQSCVKLLADELGVPPAAATVKLYTRLRVGALASDRPPIISTRTTIVSQRSLFLENEATATTADHPLLVAREQELAHLEHFLSQMLTGQGSVIFVTGEAGQGKTSLVDGFVRHSLRQHPAVVVANGNCNAFTGIGDPYLPFREILRLLTGNIAERWMAGAIDRQQVQRLLQVASHTMQAVVHTGADLVNTFIPATTLLAQAATTASPDGTPAVWLAELEALAARKRGDTSDEPRRQQDLFEQYSRVINTVAQQHPLLLVLDDLQWADAGSIALLFQLGRRIEGQRILIVGIYRPADVALGRHGERHPLAPVIHEFQRRFGANQIDLQQAGGRPLVEALVDQMPNRLGTAFRNALYQHTQGHPLFTVEMIRDLQARGNLVQDGDGYWIEGQAINWTQLPARIEGIIAERIGRLPLALQETLHIASVEGESFTAEVVARVQSMAVRAVVRQLSRALESQHRLVQGQGSLRSGEQRLSRYRFGHILFQTYVYNQLDAAERAYLHEEVGNALELVYRNRTAEIAEQLARHFEAAGLANKAVGYLHQAGTHAATLLAYAEAIAYYRRALDLLVSLPETHDRNLEELALCIALGKLLMTTKGYGAPEVGIMYERARALHQKIGDSAQAWQIFFGLCAYYRYQGKIRLARALAEECVRLVEAQTEIAPVVVAHAVLGHILFYVGEAGLSQVHLERSFALYNPQHHQNLTIGGTVPNPQIGLRILATRTLWLAGYPDQALKHAYDCLAICKEENHPYTEATSLQTVAMVHQLRREPAQAQRYTADSISIYTTHGFSWVLPNVAILEGWVQIKLGEPAAGIARISQGLADYQASGLTNKLSYYLTTLSEGYLALSQTQMGLSLLADALDWIERTDERWWEAEVYRLQGELLHRQGEPLTTVEACFQHAIAVADRQQAKSLQLRATVSLCKLWQAQGKHTLAQQHLAQIYGWFSEGFDTPDLIEAKQLLEHLSILLNSSLYP